MTRIIGGRAGSLRLDVPKTGTRPTSDRVREAIFSALETRDQVEGARVLDLFAGSGQLGIEALSRGAAHCDFVDNSKASITCVKKNVETCGFNDRAGIYGTDAFGFIKSVNENYDIILLDPPFNHGILDKMLPLAAQHVEKSGIIYCETSDKERVPEIAGNFVMDSQVKYGYIKTTYYRHKDYHEKED